MIDPSADAVEHAVRGRRLDPRRHDACWVEAEVRADERDEAAQQHSRVCKDDNRERHLRHGQRRLSAVRPQTPKPARRGRAGFVERARQSIARPQQRRRGTAQEAGDQREAGCERERDAVEGDLGEARYFTRRQRRCGAQDGRRPDKAKRSSRKTEDGVLHQQLANDVASSRAERPANRQLAPAGDPVCEEQSGHVGASHQEQKSRRRGERQKRRLERPRLLLAQPHDAGLQYRVGKGGSVRPGPIQDRPHLGGCLLGRYSRP